MINFSKIPNKAYIRCCNYDRSNAYMFITSSSSAYSYCVRAHNSCDDVIISRAEGLLKYITNSRDAYVFCKIAKDSPIVWVNITESEWAMAYCAFVKDRPEIRKVVSKSGQELKHLNNYNTNAKILVGAFIIYLIVIAGILISKMV